MDNKTCFYYNKTPPSPFHSSTHNGLDPALTIDLNSSYPLPAFTIDLTTCSLRVYILVILIKLMGDCASQADYIVRQSVSPFIQLVSPSVSQEDEFASYKSREIESVLPSCVFIWILLFIIIIIIIIDVLWCWGFWVFLWVDVYWKKNFDVSLFVYLFTCLWTDRRNSLKMKRKLSKKKTNKFKKKEKIVWKETWTRN